MPRIPDQIVVNMAYRALLVDILPAIYNVLPALDIKLHGPFDANDSSGLYMLTPTGDV